jgi:hypothetical protein
MGMRLNIYEKSPYDGLGECLLDGGAFSFSLFDGLEECESVNKYADECKKRPNYSNCMMCECDSDVYTKLTYEQLLDFDAVILSKNTNLIVSFCLCRSKCELDRKCGLDCLINQHRSEIWLNFS